MKRWNDFAQDLQEFPRESVPSQCGDVVPDDLIEAIPEQVFRAFERKWRFDLGVNKWRMLNDVCALVGTSPQHTSRSRSFSPFPIIKDAVTHCLVPLSGPIFQRICLVDLPPELLHSIEDYLGDHEVRQFGASSRNFRQLCLPCIYRVSHFSRGRF